MSAESHSEIPQASEPSASGWWKDTRQVISWLWLIIPVSLVIGAACAAFLWSLEWATRTRFDHPWLLFLLPLAGLVIGLIYHHLGGKSDAGNNLIIDQIHEPGGGVPRRMAWLVFFGTVVTHLFGGSAGREGTAVQMGGSIASGAGKLFRIGKDQLRILLMAGVAAGFGAVFGTPMAGALFAVEVVVLGRLQYDALLPCFIAALIGDWSCQALGAGHTHYHIGFLAGQVTPSPAFHYDPWLLGKVALTAVGFGLVSALFAQSTHKLSDVYKRYVSYPPLRPVIGGVLVIVLCYLVGTREFLGLGVWSDDPDAVSITSLFKNPDVFHPWAWWWKLLFTVVTLSAAFKGGEVTPLFFIGAAFGNMAAHLLGAPPDLFAGIGLVAVFAGASNTPLASTLLGIELFGATHAVPIALACLIAYLFSGHSGIYKSQRIAVRKPGWR